MKLTKKTGRLFGSSVKKKALVVGKDGLHVDTKTKRVDFEARATVAPKSQPKPATERSKEKLVARITDYGFEFPK